MRYKIVTMLSARLLILCDLLLLVNTINETSFYEDINISDRNNILAHQDLEYAESVENNLIIDNQELNTEAESLDGYSEYEGPVDTGRRKGDYALFLLCKVVGGVVVLL